MTTTFIYSLCDPATGSIRYVGKANDPHKRFKNHLCSREQNHRTNWITSLRFRGLSPVMEVLDEVPIVEWPMWEVAYIQFFKEEGCNLINGTLGGEGLCNPSVETREKMRTANLGKKQSPETIAKKSASMRGQKRSLETRIKQSVAARGKVFSPEHRAAISFARRGYKISEETRRKMSAAHIKRNIQ